MPDFMRFLALVVSGLLTVVFFVLALISGIPATKKSILVSALFMALGMLSGALAMILLDPTYILATLVGLAIGMFVLALYIGASYFNRILLEKGPRRMFSPIWQFLKRLFGASNSD